MGGKRKVYLTWLGIVISVVCLFLFARGVYPHYEETLQALRQTQVLWLFLGALSIAASLLVRAYRWRVFLGQEHRSIAIGRLFNTLTIGFFGNLVLPARAGEFLRPYMLSRAEPVRFSEAFATVVVERVFDLIAVVFAFALMCVLAPFPPEALARWEEEFRLLKFLGWLMGIGTFLFTLFLCLSVRNPGKVDRLVRRLTGWLPSHLQDILLHATESFLRGLSTFHSLKAAFHALAWTVVIWFTILLSEYFTILSFGIPVSLFGTTILMALLAFAVMVPQGPGYLGPFQLASKFTLIGYFAVAEAQAEAYAIVLWVVQLAPILVLGLGCLYLEGVTLQSFWRAVKAHEEAGT